MREFDRPPVVCSSCNTHIYAESFRLQKSRTEAAKAKYVNLAEPFERWISCPNCSAQVDTSAAYPYLENFPPSFDSLKVWYEDFSPAWEAHRESFEVWVRDTLAQHDIEVLVASLNEPTGHKWFKQRLIYRSATAFYRSLQLFLAYLTLSRHAYTTWSSVTAYYSRFYFLQAFLNLIGCIYLEVVPEGKKSTKAVFFFDGSRIECHLVNDLPKGFKRSSHEIWWSLMEALKSPSYPVEHLDFVLSRLYFDPSHRNSVNYGYEYHGGGFIELDWFDSGAVQMLSQMMPHSRSDQDITDKDRFFADIPDDEADKGDFYGDEAQILWCSLISYIELLKKLDFSQSLVKTETIMAICDVHIGKEYPILIQGIARSVSSCLHDGFELGAFLNHYSSSEHPEPITRQGGYGWNEFFKTVK